MLSTRCLLLGITSVAVAALGVWWFTQSQRKQISDDNERKSKPQTPAKRRGAPAELSQRTSAPAASTPIVPAISEVPATPPAAAAAVDLPADTNVTVRKKQHSIGNAATEIPVLEQQEQQEDEFFPEPSPIAYDPDNTTKNGDNDKAAHNRSDVVEDTDASGPFQDSMVTSLPDILQPEEVRADDEDEQGEEEDVHVVTLDNIDNIDESTSALDLSSSALDMSTSTLEEGHDHVQANAAPELNGEANGEANVHAHTAEEESPLEASANADGETKVEADVEEKVEEKVEEEPQANAGSNTAARVEEPPAEERTEVNFEASVEIVDVPAEPAADADEGESEQAPAEATAKPLSKKKSTRRSRKSKGHK